MRGRLQKRALSSAIIQILLILIVLLLIAVIALFLLNFLGHQVEYFDKKAELSAQAYSIDRAKIVNQNPLTINLLVSQIQGKELSNISGINISIVPIALDIVNIVDLSGSMNNNISATVQVKKIDLLKNVSKTFNNNTINKTNGNISLVAFNNTIVSTLNSSRNLAALNNRVDSWNANGNTCLCCGINTARAILEKFSKPSAQKFMIVMTDGETNRNCTGGQNTANAISTAINASCSAYVNLSNLTIYTIGFGVNQSYVWVLKNISSRCGNGTYFDADNVADFISAYSQISENIIQKSIQRIEGTFLVFVFTSKNGQTYSRKEYDFPSELLSAKSYTFTDLPLPSNFGELAEVCVYPGTTLTYGGTVYSTQQNCWKF
jgi:hypothetical protein